MPAAPVKKTDFPRSTRSTTCLCSSQRSSFALIGGVGDVRCGGKDGREASVQFRALLNRVRDSSVRMFIPVYVCLCTFAHNYEIRVCLTVYVESETVEHDNTKKDTSG